MVSALVFRKRLGWLHRAWASGQAVPVVCRETVQELIRVLAYPKFRLLPDERQMLLAEYVPFAETVLLPSPPPAIPKIFRDRSDAVFVQLTLTAKADQLVTGDSDLWQVSDLIPVASPAELRCRLEATLSSEPS